MAKINNKEEYLKLAQSVIKNFDLEENHYSSSGLKNVIVKNNENKSSVYMKSTINKVTITVDFHNTKRCKVYIGENIKGNITIKVHSDDSLVYIGNNGNFRRIVIDSNQRNDLIAIGNDISVNINNQWRSGLRAGEGNPAIIIGDDCMFATDVVLRNTDAHPIYSLETDKQVNFPKKLILIEPHVWIGQQVNVLKDVTIGACSIVALGSIVTKDMNRFSIIKGAPAKGVVDKTIYWSVSMQKHSKDRAKYYIEKYLEEKN